MIGVKKKTGNLQEQARKPVRLYMVIDFQPFDHQNSPKSNPSNPRPGRTQQNPAAALVQLQKTCQSLLVGGIPTPLKMMEFVSWDDEIPN
jgi:hypothetical protein